jgi:hypothetical protein
VPRKRGHPVAEANDRVPLALLEAAALLGEVAAELVRIHRPFIDVAVYVK